MQDLNTLQCIVSSKYITQNVSSFQQSTISASHKMYFWTTKYYLFMLINTIDVFLLLGKSKSYN